MSQPDLLYHDVEDALRAAVRSFLTPRLTARMLLSDVDSVQTSDDALWKGFISDLGLAALLVPEELGGAGGAMRDAALVMEELGRSLAPVPFLTSAAMATQCLAHCDALAEPATGELLSRLGQGLRTAAIAVCCSARTLSEFPSSVTARDARLSGSISSVIGATGADVLIVPAICESGNALYVADSHAPGVHVTAAPTLDVTRPVCDVRFDDVPAHRVAAGATAQSALDHALLVGAGLLVSEQLGVAEWCLDRVVAYAKERRQFGRAIGSFQAVKHRLARLWVDVVTTRAAARNAADALTRSRSSAVEAVATAKSHASQTAVRVAEECLQLHGGIAMTWEYPVHLYLKRAKSTQIMFGSPSSFADLIAAIADLPAPQT